MPAKLLSLFADEQGQGTTEYGLVLGFIAFGVVVILIAMRGNILQLFNKVNNDVSNAAAVQ